MRIYFKPKKGFKPILITFRFLTLILIPTFTILLVTKTPFLDCMIFLLFTYGLIACIGLLVQYKTKYWIKDNALHYTSLFTKGAIEINSIRKIEINASYWQSGMPATSNINGILIYFGKFDDLYISPEDNEALSKQLLQIKPTIEIVYSK